ncbi:hypothetical protein SLS57_006646 [Botryosphaeria dothidea]
MTSQQLPNDEPGVLKMAHQLSIWAKDGDPEKGIEHDTKFYTFSGQVPWAMPPCTEKITPDSAAEATDIPKPKVVLLRLLGPQDEQDHSFPHSCQRLLGFLKTEADIKTAFTAADALDFITNDHPQAVIVSDPALTVRDTASPCYKPAASIVLEKLKTYVAAGGRAIFCCYFTLAHPIDVGPFFKTHFNRSWVWLALHRAVVEYQPAALENFPPNDYLKKYYNIKSCFLKGVDPSEALYKDPKTEGSRDDLTAAAYGKFGNGYIGWIGDDNKELLLDEAVFAMCGFTKLHPQFDKWYPDTSVRVDLTGAKVGGTQLGS